MHMQFIAIAGVQKKIGIAQAYTPDGKLEVNIFGRAHIILRFLKTNVELT